MLHFAYDGTIHGDWVGNYAVQLASHQADRTLNLLHVQDSRRAVDDLDHKLDHFRSVCQRSGVNLVIRKLLCTRSIFETLKTALNTDANSLLICGTRAGRAQRDILQGTVAERFLRAKNRPTLAIRVNNPGVLGIPSRLLVPIRPESQQFKEAFPVLKLLAHDGRKVSLFCVESVSAFQSRRLTHDRRERLLSHGRDYCFHVEHQL